MLRRADLPTGLCQTVSVFPQSAAYNILLLGKLASKLAICNFRFEENDEKVTRIANKEAIENFAELTGVEYKKISWALTNYCLIRGGNAIRKRNTCYEATQARDVLANTLYARLVDYVIGLINNKLAFGKAIL